MCSTVIAKRVCRIGMGTSNGNVEERERQMALKPTHGCGVMADQTVVYSCCNTFKSTCNR